MKDASPRRLVALYHPSVYVASFTLESASFAECWDSADRRSGAREVLTAAVSPRVKPQAFDTSYERSSDLTLLLSKSQKGSSPSVGVVGNPLPSYSSAPFAERATEGVRRFPDS